MNAGEILFNKTIVGIGLILLLAGVAISLFSSQETYTDPEPETVKNLTVGEELPRILDPQNTTSYGTFMNSSRWFVLNISSSSSVKVMISLIQHPTGESVKTPIWEQTGDNFRQEVSISGSGTYFVDIINENSFSVTLDGNVLVQQEVERYRTIYPYVIPGFLIMLGGISVCIFGIFRMAKKPSRSKSVTKKK